jgi:hypothetical protein
MKARDALLRAYREEAGSTTDDEINDLLSDIAEFVAPGPLWAKTIARELYFLGAVLTKAAHYVEHA